MRILKSFIFSAASGYWLEHFKPEDGFTSIEVEAEDNTKAGRFFH